MQETDFIHQNQSKWEEFEEVLQTTEKDPERLTDLYIETTDDLSYSRTYYPNRSVRVYLNGIAQQVYQALYKNRQREKGIVGRFWIEDLPQALWYSRKALLLSFLLFATGLFVGILSSIYYPEFAKIILGDGYIEMTKANIEQGDPMAVYKDSEPFEMFFRIALNNILIAYGTFVLGILFGLGTVYVILYNSIMVGAFVYFFIERGLFKESFLAIMLHGTLELSMIVIAGCAGFTLARGLLFPGTYTRGQALIQSARSGIKILLAVTIFLFYAALIESFATRHTDISDIIRLIIILISAAIVIGYFVWFPWYLYKKGRIPEIPIEEKPNPQRKAINILVIKSSGKIFTETFTLFSKNIRAIGYSALIISSIITIYFGIATSFKYHNIYDYYYINFGNPLGFLYPFSSFNFHLNFELYPIFYLVLAVLFGTYSLLFYRISNNQLGSNSIRFGLIEIINSLSIAAISMLPLLLAHAYTLITLWCWFPLCLFWLFVSLRQKKLFIQALRPTIQLIKGNFWKLISTFISTLTIQWIAYFLLSSQIAMLIGEFIQTNVARNAYLAEEVQFIVMTFLLFLLPSIMLSLSLFGTVLFYYSALETNEANSLKLAIEKVGFKKRAYGLEKEA